MPSSTDEKILDVLTKILQVLAIQLSADKSITEGARLLKLAGLDNETIANVLNTSSATVRTVTTNLRTWKKAQRMRRRD
jgi:3-hydroxyisobutyrate dehydrogenase-like beta-hydroxyacid dehydrogenase